MGGQGEPPARSSPNTKDNSSVADMIALDHSSALANKKCHEKVDFYLHRPIVEYLVIFLIIVDCILVTASLLLEIKIVEAEAKEDCDSNPSTTHKVTSEGHATAGTKISKLEHVAEALHFASLAILSLFLIEVFLKLYGQREKFFHRKIQVVDSFIVAISFALDIAVIIINDIDSSILNGLSLIIILRLWRLVRIVNGAVVATKEQLTEKIHEIRHEAEHAKEQASTLQMQLEDKDREIEFLKSRLCKYEPIDMVPTGSTRLPAYLPETKEFPKGVLGDVTDDEDYRTAFCDINNHTGPRIRQRPVLNQNSAFQAYQPGTTYQPTSQYPSDQMKSHAVNPRAAHYVPHDNYNGNLDMPQSGSYHHENDALDTADESDVVSIKPPKSRSGNTFTVKKDGVPMTSL